MDRDNVSLLIISIVFIAVIGGGALFIVTGYMGSQSQTATLVPAPQTYGRSFAYPQQQFNSYEHFSNAIEDLTSQLERDPENVEAYRERGLAFEQLADLTSALKDYDAALKIDPEDSETLLVRAKLYYTRQKMEKAQADYSKLIELGKGNGEVYAARGYINSRAGNYDAAVADYTSAMEFNEGHYGHLNGRAWANQEAGNIKAAIDDYTKVISIHPNWVKAYHNRAFAWWELYNLDAAVMDIKKAIRLQPGDSDILADYARILHESGKLPEALDIANQSVDLQNISQTRGSWIRARIKRDMGDYEGAYSDLDKALAPDPGNTNLLDERAWLSWVKGDLTRAQVDFEWLAGLQPSNFYNHLSLGVNQYHLGNYSQAQEHLGLAVTLRENDIDYAHLYLWLSHVRANDQEQADKNLREFAGKRKPHLTDVDEDDWPGKLVAFLLGDLSSNDLLEIAQTDIPLQTAQRKCEAYFYIGSIELIKRNDSKAAEYFKQSMQTNVTTYYEYNSAASELRVLGELE